MGHEKRGIRRLATLTSRDGLATKVREPHSKENTGRRVKSFIFLRFVWLFVSEVKAVHGMSHGRLR
jgi:hypothetical protein